MVDFEQLEQDAQAPAVEVSADDMETLIGYGNELEYLKAEADRLKAEAAQVRDRYDVLRKELIPAAMQRLGLVAADGKGSFTLSSGARIHLRTDTYASCLKADEAALQEWLRANGHGSLIREVVYPATLRSFVVELLSEEQELPPEIKVYTETTAVLTPGRS